MAGENGALLRHLIPEGVKDRLPREAANMRQISTVLVEQFRRWGYHEVITPAFEFLDNVSLETGCLGRREDFYQLFDLRGRTLVLRPDMTAPIARLAASKLSSQPSPLRLSYWGPVFRRRERRFGSMHEIWQAGVELLGVGGARADAEVVAMAGAALAETGLSGFQIGIGHVDLVAGIMAAAGVNADSAVALQAALGARDLVEFEKLAKAGAGADGARLLLELADFQGGFSEAKAIFEHLPSLQVQQALQEIGDTLAFLASYGVADQVTLDLGLARNFDYYTGVVFEGYAPGVGAPILGGGRYDRLLADMGGSPLPATGFALDIDRLLQALERQKRLPGDHVLDVLVAAAPGYEGAAMARARVLRGRGLAVEVELQGLTGAELAAYARRRRVGRVETVSTVQSE